MNLSGEFVREINFITNKFEAARKNGSLSIGSFDGNIKRFICKVLEKVIEEYEDEEKYFDLMEVIDEFIERMHLSGDGSDWFVWSNVDFGKLNELSIGLKDEISKIKEVRNFYC